MRSPVSLVPLTLCPNFPGVGLGAYRFDDGVLTAGRADSCVLRTGDSGRATDGRPFLMCGLGARIGDRLPGPSDWLNMDFDGVGGV